MTDAVRPGEENIVALKIVNPGQIPLENPREQKPVHPTGMLNYLGNWGGIYGSVELLATDATFIEGLYVRPDIEKQVARFVVTVESSPPQRAHSKRREVAARHGEHAEPLSLPVPDEVKANVGVRVDRRDVLERSRVIAQEREVCAGQVVSRVGFAGLLLIEANELARLLVA